MTGPTPRVLPPAPDLGPPVAVLRSGRARAVEAGLVVLALLVGFSWLRSRDVALDRVDVLNLSVFCVLGAVVLFTVHLRAFLAVGVGWMKYQGLIGSVWVRTDRLVEVRSSALSGDWGLDFLDSDGRTAFVTASRLQSDEGLRRRVAADVRTSLAGGAEVDERARALVLGVTRGRGQR